jgi:hypothetical protein
MISRDRIAGIPAEDHLKEHTGHYIQMNEDLKKVRLRGALANCDHTTSLND